MPEPECENPYKSHSRIDTLITKEKVWDEGFEKGQQNPDPKQYANKKELVEEIRSCGITVDTVLDDYADDQIEVVTMGWLLDRIRTHGLEE